MHLIAGGDSKIMLKILFNTYQLAFQNKGGGEIQLLKTKEYLEKLGCKVDLFNKWNTKIKEYDVVHNFSLVDFCLEVCQGAKLYGAKLAISPINYLEPTTWRNLLFRNTKKLLRKILHKRANFFFSKLEMLRLADIILPNSSQEGEWLIAHFGIDRKKIFPVPNGVDEKFGEGDAKLFIRKFGVRDFILCVGRICPQKNQLRLIRALKGIDIPLVFVGEPDPAFMDYYRLCCEEAEKNMVFIGALEHDDSLLASAYAAANTLVLPSLYETTGLVALEAALAGAKVVITEKGYSREYFGEMVTYINPYSEKSIRLGVLKTLELPKNCRLKEHVEQNFLWSQVAERVLEGYEKVIKG